MIKIKKYQIEDYISDATQDALDLKADLVDGKVPASQLPSFVDDVIEVANYAALPIPGATGVIYITLDTNKVYRWTGSVYVEISSGVTNLSYTPGVSNGVVNSDTGSDATIPLAGTVNAGLFSAAEKSKLEGIAPNANVGVIPNAPITGATKTKITYDSKGLVTSGDDATTADISSSTNKRYVTDANLTVINNTSGTNTGDQNLQQVVNLGNGISNYGGSGNATIQSTNFSNNRTLYLNSNANPTIKLEDNLDGNHYTVIDIDTLNLSGVSYNWSSIVGGTQDLQEVTDIGASTTNGITITVGDGGGDGIHSSSTQSYGVYGSSSENIGVYGTSTSGTGVYGIGTIGVSAYSTGGTGIEVYGNGTIAIEANLGNTNKGLVINSGTSSTGNPIEINKNGVDKLIVNQQGELTAQKLIKDGGTSSQILAADGSVITAGNNITITGGQISSVGGAGGGSSVNYYLNGGTSQGTFGGTTYYEFSKTAVIGTGADFNISSNGYIASFITDVADPSLLLIPAGNWNLEFFFSSSSAGGLPSFYVELYKYDGTTFTLIATNSTNPEGITGGTSIDAYFTPLAVPETILTVNDRLAIRVFVNASSKTITLHTQNGHLCEVITTFTSGLTALNGLQAQVQNFATGTTGTDFDIVSSGSTHTFNLPSASATARGLVSIGTQTFAGDKTFTGSIGIENSLFVSTNTDIAISAVSQDSDAITGETTNGIGVFGGSTNGLGGYFNTVNGANIAEFRTNFILKASVSNDGSMTAAKYLYSGGSIFPEFSQTFYINGTGSTHYFGGGTSNVQNNLEVSNGTLKIGLQTASTIASFDSSKNVVSLPLATYPSLTELTYVRGVTSAIQTQLNNKAPLISPTFTGTVVLPSTTSIGTVSSTEISYLDNVTSSIQTQLDGKVDENTAITGATKTKITYDSKGLVTAGADIATTDISDFNSATRAQVEAELVAGTNITITPSGTGATRQLTIAATGGGASSQSAFTVLANNTNATAAPTEHVFKSVAEQTYSGTITWSASAPQTILSNTYEWQQIGKMVNLRVNLSYSAAGTNQQVIITLPSDLPNPKNITGFTSASEIICFGSGMIFLDRAVLPASAGRSCLLRRNAANNGYELVVTHGSSISVRNMALTIQYFA